ncbi:MAG: TIM barrel protein, partial [Steroidobacteraceae bacterium]|nr:TIM barrel protein [Steroidobacteraceae bacterium]
MELSANIELLFREAGDDIADRVLAAADAGIAVVEIWQHSNKDLPRLQRALQRSGVRLQTLLIEGHTPLADRDAHGAFLEQVRRACQAAQTLGCPHVVTGSGVGLPFLRRPQQAAIVADALAAAAQIAGEYGIVILLENLNTRVDHPGTLFDRTADCVAAIRSVGSP